MSIDHEFDKTKSCAAFRRGRLSMEKIKNMKARQILFPALFLFAAVSCNKDQASPVNCTLVSTGIIAGDKEDIAATINGLINNLSSQEYTEDNLNRLVLALNQNCGTAAKIFCFDCIKTIPTQSEIRVTVTEPGRVINKTIDITYNAANKMVFQNLHD